MIYLLDANTLIEAKNRYYSMSVCPGYQAAEKPPRSRCSSARRKA